MKQYLSIYVSTFCGELCYGVTLFGNITIVHFQYSENCVILRTEMRIFEEPASFAEKVWDFLWNSCIFNMNLNGNSKHFVPPLYKYDFQYCCWRIALMFINISYTYHIVIEYFTCFFSDNTSCELFSSSLAATELFFSNKQ